MPTRDLTVLVPVDGLATDSIRLRRPRVDDAEWLVHAGTDNEVVAFTDIPQNITTADAARWIERRLDGWAEGWRAGFFIETNAGLAGYVNLRIDWTRGSGELGYWLRQPWRGRGVMTAAIRVVRDWAFEVVGLARLQATVEPANEASLQVVDRLSFTREGLLRSYDVLKGRRHDVWMLSLLANDPRT